MQGGGGAAFPDPLWPAPDKKAHIEKFAVFVLQLRANKLIIMFVTLYRVFAYIEVCLITEELRLSDFSARTQEC